MSFHLWGSEGTTEHGHNYYEIFLVTDGRVCHEINGKISEISKGTLCMICPGDIHQLRRIENFSSIHMNICLSPKKFEEICSALGIDPEAFEAQKPLTAALSTEEQAYKSHKQAHRRRIRKSDERNMLDRIGFYLDNKQLEAHAENRLPRVV